MCIQILIFLYDLKKKIIPYVGKDELEYQQYMRRIFSKSKNVGPSVWPNGRLGFVYNVVYLVRVINLFFCYNHIIYILLRKL